MPSHVNSVDFDGNNILMIFLESQFNNPELVNEQNSKQILDFLNLIILNPNFKVCTINDFLETAKDICTKHLKTNAKNKVAQDILRSAIYMLCNRRDKTDDEDSVESSKSVTETPVEITRVDNKSCVIL